MKTNNFAFPPSKLYLKIIVGLIILLALVYFIPAPKANFSHLYPDKDSFSINLRTLKQRHTKEVEIAGILWKYYASGSGSPAILFLHGMGGAAEIWWNQILEFEHHYRVISYTLPEQITTLSQAEEGIMSLLDKEHIQQFYVVGTSMGGYIAQYLMEKHPDRVKKAVFGNTFPPNDMYRKENNGKRKVMPYVPELLIWSLGKKQLKKEILPAAGNNKLLAAVLPSLPFSKKQFIGRYDVVVDNFIPHPDRQQIRNIPKLIIESDNDPLIYPVLRKQLKQLYSEAQVYTFHDQGHFPYVNAANEYNEVLHAFLD